MFVRVHDAGNDYDNIQLQPVNYGACLKLFIFERGYNVYCKGYTDDIIMPGNYTALCMF